MKAAELRGKSDSELSELESELRRDLINLRIAQATGGDVNASKFTEIRRNVARLKTIQTERAKENQA